jgi:hypothetical protein
MDNESQSTERDPWNEIRRVIGDGTASDVLALACPECGSALQIYFYPGDKAIVFPTRLQFAAVNIDCVQFCDGLRIDGWDISPPWVLELGEKITTKPA